MFQDTCTINQILLLCHQYNIPPTQESLWDTSKKIINEDKLRGKSEHREELESERGPNIVGVPAGRQAFPWHPSRSTRRQTTDKPSPGTPLGAPGDRQAFPWHPSRSTRRQTTDKPSPGTPLGAPGDRQAFPWHPSRSTMRQTTQRQAFPWHPSRSTRRHVHTLRLGQWACCIWLNDVRFTGMFQKQPWTTLNPTTTSKYPPPTYTYTHTHTHTHTHTQNICTFLLKYTSIFQARIALPCSKCLWQVPVILWGSRCSLVSRARGGEKFVWPARLGIQLQCCQFPRQRLKNALVFPNTRHCC